MKLKGFNNLLKVSLGRVSGLRQSIHFHNRQILITFDMTVPIARQRAVSGPQ